MSNPNRNPNLNANPCDAHIVLLNLSVCLSVCLCLSISVHITPTLIQLLIHSFAPLLTKWQKDRPHLKPDIGRTVDARKQLMYRIVLSVCLSVEIKKIQKLSFFKGL